MTASGGTQACGLRVTVPALVTLTLWLAPAMPAGAADASPRSRGCFGVGSQNVFWYAWGVDVSADLSPNVTLDGFRSVTGDTSYGGRLRIRLRGDVQRRIYAYGVVGSRRLTQITGTRFSRDIGSDLPVYGSETGIGAGLGIGVEQSLRRWISDVPLFVSAEVGAEHVGGFKRIDGGYTSPSLGVGLWWRF
jgi:hypothetical protein